MELVWLETRDNLSKSGSRYAPDAGALFSKGLLPKKVISYTEQRDDWVLVIRVRVSDDG